MPTVTDMRNSAPRPENRSLFIIAVICLAIVAGCSGKKSFTISGKLQDAKNKYISISWIEVDRPVFIDSTKVKQDGSFRFRIEADEPGFYQISASASDFVTVLATPGEKMSLTFKGEFLSQGFEVQGSPGTSKIVSLDSALAVTKSRIDSLTRVLEEEQGKADFESLSKEIDNKYIEILKEQRMNNIKFVLANLNSYASIKALYQRIDENTYVFYDYRDLQYMKLVSDTLSRYYPNSKQVKALKANFEKELNAMNMSRLEEMTKNAQEKTLDPTLKDVSGKRISLSSLKGKYVLLTFWAAASPDCLSENLELKKLYSKYKNKGFEIYQINLDLNEDTWMKAVKYDELPWISVREDDPLKPENALLYNVKVLPTNYLYDRSGSIIGTNLHGRALQIKLVQLFGS